jgi:hypothetical protein
MQIKDRVRMIFYEEIFRAFKKQKVKYVLVGEVAVNSLGRCEAWRGWEPRLREDESLF